MKSMKNQQPTNMFTQNARMEMCMMMAICHKIRLITR